MRAGACPAAAACARLLAWRARRPTTGEGLAVKAILGALALCGMVFAGNANASETVTDNHRFQLWNNCEPIGLKIFDASTIPGFSKKEVGNAIRSQLRIARINISVDNPRSILLIIMFGNKTGHSFSVFFQKASTDDYTGIRKFTITWMQRPAYFGTINNASRILPRLTSAIHKFIEDYLRVNADAC